VVRGMDHVFFSQSRKVIVLRHWSTFIDRYGVVILLSCASNVFVTYALSNLVDSTSLATGWRRLI